MRKTETRRQPYRSHTRLQASDTRGKKIIVETLATAQGGQSEVELEMSILQGCFPPLYEKVTLTRLNLGYTRAQSAWQVPDKGGWERGEV